MSTGPTSVSSSVLFEVAALTHRGAVRAHNEDAIALGETLLMGDMREPLVLALAHQDVVLLADGMGGHAFGELASRTSVEALIGARRSLADEAGCRQAIADASARLFDLMRRRPETLGMGTTVVGAVLVEDRLVHFNVGDSRAYRHSPGGLRQISRDDVPHPGGAGPRRVSHVITQCLGGHAWDTGIDPHIATAPPLRPGETLLLCSDGLTDMADDEEIARVLEAVRDPGACASDLFKLAMDAGGVDNISVVVVRAVVE